MEIKLYYFTGKNGDFKESKRVFKNFVALYNNLNTFKNIKSISIFDDNLKLVKCIEGHYNVINYVANVGGRV